MANEYSCCASPDVRQTRVKVGGATIGLAKLDRVFEQLYNSGKIPIDIDSEEIVDLVSFYNYIPPDAVGAYAEALVPGICQVLQRPRTSGSVKSRVVDYGHRLIRYIYSENLLAT